MPESTFDVDALFVAMDRKRRAERLYWRDVARASGCSPSTFSRMAYGAAPNADGLCRLLLWLGTTDLKPFITEAVGG